MGASPTPTPAPTPGAATQLEPNLMMGRSSLVNLPAVVIPGDLSFRWFRDGDDKHWETIVNAVFDWKPGEGTFDKQMRADRSYFSADHVGLIFDGDKPVATASAWHRPVYGASAGMVHWVGAMPTHQGRGLGGLVTLICLHRFLAEGRTSAVLRTQDFRLPAIKTYLKLGFEPVIVHENQHARWKTIYEHLKLPSPDTNKFERFDDSCET